MNGPALRVVQLSDCHVSARADRAYRGVDARAGFESLLPRVLEWSPDVLLATGDLSEDGSPESYAWLHDRFASLGLPVLALPGNHDDPRVMARWFRNCAGEEPLVHDAGGWRLVLLDSSRPGAIEGYLADRSLDRLAHLLAGDERPALVALHHQPLDIGSPWIDRYALREPERMWKAIEAAGTVRVVVWGHVHQAVDREIHGLRALGAPSTASNSLPGRERFTHDPAGPACRWLELTRDGGVRTGLLGP